MNTETATNVIELHCVASAMGCVPIRRLVDAETGEAMTFAFIRGVPIPYACFMSLVLSVMTGSDDRHGQIGDQYLARLTPIWTRVKLAAGARQMLEENHSVANVVRALVRKGYLERVKTAGIDPIEQVRRFVQEIEEAHSEALEDPLTVTGLTALSEPLIYAAPWSEGARKAEMAKREQEAHETAATWKKLTAQNAAQHAPQPARRPMAHPVMASPQGGYDKVKAATAKLLDTVRKAQRQGLRVEDDGY
jgi:hypothetical protein